MAVFGWWEEHSEEMEISCVVKEVWVTQAYNYAILFFFNGVKKGLIMYIQGSHRHGFPAFQCM